MTCRMKIVRMVVALKFLKTVVTWRMSVPHFKDLRRVPLTQKHKKKIPVSEAQEENLTVAAWTSELTSLVKMETNGA